MNRRGIYTALGASLCLNASCTRDKSARPPAESARTVVVSASQAASFDSAAMKVVDFLRGRRPIDAVPDSVTLYVVPEGGGGTRTLRGRQIGDRRNWTVRSGSTTYTFVPPVTFT